MIRDSILDAELAEPTIGKVHLHLTADQPLRADRKDIPYDQHPDHQLRIDRRATRGRIMRRKFAAKPGQIESSVDLAHQMIFGDRVAKTKLVEQLTLVTLQTAHHGSTSCDSRQHNGITLGGLSQPTFATKSARSEHSVSLSASYPSDIR